MAQPPPKPSQPGARAPVSLRDVADLAQVHISTASRALDPAQAGRISAATVKRVRAAASKIGYTPDLVAAGLKRGRTQSVGVVVADFDNPYNGLLIRGLSRVLEAQGFVAVVAESAEQRTRLAAVLDHFTARRVDAVVSTAAHLGDADLFAPLIARQIPVVLGVRGLPASGFATVLHDDFRGGELAGAHLRELGHTVVARLRGPVDIDSFIRRDAGFNAGIAGAEQLVDVTIDDCASIPDIAEGRRLMEATLAQRQRPTAVFAHNDVMAVGVLQAMEGAGLRCPRDISVVGYNDVPLSSHLSPPLTTVRLPSELLGRRLGETLLARIEDPSLPGEELRLPAELVIRRSTARAGAARRTRSG